jgi:hypothetical protein
LTIMDFAVFFCDETREPRPVSSGRRHDCETLLEHFELKCADMDFTSALNICSLYLVGCHCQQQSRSRLARELWEIVWGDRCGTTDK